MAFNPAMAALQAQIAAVEADKPKRGGKFPKKAKRGFTPGPEIKFAKGGGSFGWKVPNAKGTLIAESSLKLKGVIFDAKFRWRDAGMESGEFEQRCVTVGHTELGEDPENPGKLIKVEGNGWWSVPAYDHATIFKNFNPHGTQDDPELKDAEGNAVPLTCQRCHELGYNLKHKGQPYDKETNPIMCKDEGYIAQYTTHVVNPKTEEWVDLTATGEGFLASVKMGRSSLDPYTRFMGKLMTEYQTDTSGVVTEFQAAGPDKMGNYRLAPGVGDVLEPDLMAIAQAAWDEAKAVNAAELQEYIDKKKAEREASGGGGGKGSVTNIADKRAGVGAGKPVGAAAGAAKPKAAPAPQTDSDDGDDDETIPF